MSTTRILCATALAAVTSIAACNRSNEKPSATTTTSGTMTSAPGGRATRDAGEETGEPKSGAGVSPTPGTAPASGATPGLGTGGTGAGGGGGGPR
jgi:hypothetical protein